MPEPLRLLAKSRQGSRELSVAEHCGDTADKFLKVFAPGSRCLANWLRFFRLPEDQAFLRDGQVASLFHDIGKANEDFFNAVDRPGGNKRQAIRHEHLSGLVLCLQPVREWLQKAGCDYDAVIAAVLSHHAKVSPADGDQFYWAGINGPRTIVTYMRHPEVTAIIKRIGDIINSPFSAELPTDAWPSPTWEQAWNDGMDMARDLEIADAQTFDQRRNHLLAVKAAVIVADSVASGLWREDRKIDRFLSERLHRTDLTGDSIRNEIIERRIGQIRDQGKWRDWSAFQLAADNLGDRAAIIAGCGVGKTLAAWRWAAAAADRQRLGAVIFLYPTRATATEGFKDYVAWAPESDATLLTGTAALDLAGMRANPPEPMRGKQFEDETDARLFALANWKRRYFSATLDQFLSFLEHGYSGMCLLPQFADAAVIIDEVHSLDRHLFARLCALLTHFRGPVLLMTATLPRERVDALRDLDVRIFPDERERSAMSDLVADEDRKRYRLFRAKNAEDALTSAVSRDVSSKRSTLWVVNTVRRCQALALRLRDMKLDPLVYHSRFTARDRRRRHQDVITAFQNHQSKRWAISTQVCEMSLDLDSDRIVSEDAPLPAIIQRAGRGNRKRISTDPADVNAGRARSPDFRAEMITYKPEDGRPYSLEDEGAAAVDGAGRFCMDHDQQEIGQHDLAKALLNPVYAPDQARPEASAGFLTAGWFATARPLRGEDNDRDVRCVLSTDLDRGLNADGMPGDDDPLDAWLISVPRRFVLSLAQRDEPPARERDTWLEKLHLHIADGTRYDPDLGFLLIDLE
jgi:CRISPR-associated endonuclease/helicase Cas3